MTNPRLPEPVEKTELGYRAIQKRLTVMRREGKVPYGWSATRPGAAITPLPTPTAPTS